MTFVITQPCIDTRDQACVEVCPVDCIHFEESEDRMLYINPAECIDCGACQPACPVSAIFPEADVPADQAAYTPINALWFEDPAAARAQVEQLAGGGAPAPAAAAPAAAAQPAAEAAPAEAASTGEAAPAAEEAEAPAAAAAPAPAPAPAAAAAPAAAPVPAYQYHVEAAGPEETAPSGGVILPHHRLPSPLGIVTAAAAMLLYSLAWIYPGPTLFEFDAEALPFTDQVRVGVVAAALVGLSVLFLLGFVASQVREFARFGAHQVYREDPWRLKPSTWRRSEENRRFELEHVVQDLAKVRFAYPDEDHPDWRTYVNLPEPQMALEVGGEKVFPDVIVTGRGNVPMLVGQIETRETVTREQAERVWSKLETAETPLYLYVPAGLAGRAKRFAKVAGLKHVKFRTWRRQPWGMIVEEV